MQKDTTNASLSPGTLIGRYEIREVLGIGGFGITYKAWDTKLNRLVAMKEYLPSETAVRVQGSSQINAYESRADEYQYGLERFLDEAKTLAKFHHPNIIGVLDHLELNNTAYLIMTYEQGQTLSQQLKHQGGTLPELELKAITKAILTGLQHIHEQDYYHRDIKPGNIYIRKQGEPVLIDFGAARQAIGARSRSLTNIVSTGYAPSEQYGSNQSKQGPWSDLYAVGATMYRCISGQDPSDAPTRSSEIMEGDPDPLTPASKIGQGYYTDEQLQLIDWMLAPAIKNRPQNVSQVLTKLEQSPISNSNPGTQASRVNQDPRSTVATKLVTEGDYQQQAIERQEKLVKNNNQDRNTQINETKIKQPKSKRLSGIAGIAIIILAVIGFTQKPQLEQLIGGGDPIKIDISNSEQIKPEKQTQDEIVHYRVEQELKRKQQQLQAEKEAKAKQDALLKQQTIALQKQQTIQNLLSTAEGDIKKMRLSSPKGNNAVEKYQQVLQLEADNPLAKQGISNVAEKYLQLLHKSSKQQQYDKARRYLQKVKAIQPENATITQTEETLKKAEQNYRQEQQRLAEQNRQRQLEITKREEEKRLIRHRELAKREAEDSLKRERKIAERKVSEARIRAQRESREIEALINRKEKVDKQTLNIVKTAKLEKWDCKRIKSQLKSIGMWIETLKKFTREKPSSSLETSYKDKVALLEIYVEKGCS